MVSRPAPAHHSFSVLRILSSLTQSMAWVSAVLRPLVRRGALLLILGFWLSSSAVAQGQTAPTLKVNGSSAPITVAGGSTLTVTVQNGPGNQWDCVSLNASPNVNAAWLSYAFLTPFSTSGTMTFTMPSAAGTYGVLFWQNCNTWIMTGPPVTVQSGSATGDINYVYDRLGRLIAVIAGSEMAIYRYDAVGNLLSIMRQSSAAVSILDFSPRSGSPGTSITILGTGFSSTASQNTVTFNGVTATVLSAATTQLIVQVPFGGTLGPIAVSSPNGSATSTRLFGVSP